MPNCIPCFGLDTIEKEMRSLFDIPTEKETRLWNKYMSNTYEQLNKPDSTVQDAGLFQGQVGLDRSKSFISLRPFGHMDPKISAITSFLF